MQRPAKTHVQGSHKINEVDYVCTKDATSVKPFTPLGTAVQLGEEEEQQQWLDRHLGAAPCSKNENLSENVRKVLAKKQRKKLKEERELYKATKAISTQNNAQRKINAQNQLSSSSFVQKMKDINKAFPHIRSKEDKNYMKENFMKIQEKVSLQKKVLEQKEEAKNKKPFKMKRFENVASKVAKNLQKTGESSLGLSKATMSNRVITEGSAARQVEEDHVECQDEGIQYAGEDGEEAEYQEGDEAEYDEEVEYEEEEEEEVEYQEGEEAEYGEEEVEYEEGEEEVEYEEEETENLEEEPQYLEASSKCQGEKREDAAAETDHVSAPAKHESSIIEKLSKRGSELRSTEKDKRNNLHKNFGKLPTYMLKKKKDVVDESTDVPEGYRVLKHDERNYVLKELHSQLTEATQEYKTNKDNSKKIELGKKIKEIKESIELFSKPNVLVNENF
ncbi:hypothetical protein C922_01715 [Plasmodium inui San Antonio 1]|uniref:Enkurin domain-containing protein n=1 Tax=Plasmodium inui San Antonio 1 TaxID=1237626 RepID=W7AA15_9APIC|nr:hypothetical protein C922_01715 [Plasmodium inui San Antonio 1]EUD68103.1 hypothetical protein C922_01715 [Plasmodium inui San Antonio 1]